MQTKLILVEGLPGTGKSSTCQWLAEQLNTNGIAATWHYEISASHPLKRSEPLTGMSDEKLLEHGIETWARFIDVLGAADKVSVVDAGHFQHIILDAFLREVPIDDIVDYANEVASLSSTLNPVLISLSPDDVSEHLERTYTDRGPKFVDIIVAWSSVSLHSRRRGYKGRSGSMQFWSDYSVVCNRLFKDSSMNKLRIETCRGGTVWQDRWSQILRFLDVSEASTPHRRKLNERAFVGTYRCDKTNTTLQVTKRGGQFWAAKILEPLQSESVLFVSDKNRLTVRGHDVDLVFDIEPGNLAAKVHVYSSWPRLDGVTLDRCR